MLKNQCEQYFLKLFFLFLSNSAVILWPLQWVTVRYQENRVDNIWKYANYLHHMGLGRIKACFIYHNKRDIILNFGAHSNSGLILGSFIEARFWEGLLSFIIFCNLILSADVSKHACSIFSANILPMYSSFDSWIPRSSSTWFNIYLLILNGGSPSLPWELCYLFQVLKICRIEKSTSLSFSAREPKSGDL